MFHQVKVPSVDADALRFLWWENDDLDEPPAEFQMVSHIFGAADLPSCANYSLKRSAEDFSKEAVETTKREFYVDDLIKAVSTVGVAVQLVHELVDLLKRGGFHLTKWMSNSREVLATISEKERAKPNLNLDIEKLPIERALGVLWKVERDVFKFEVRKTDKHLTKRGILSTVSSLYDPMGFVYPVILKAKKIMQQLWKLQVGWDEPIPAEEQLHWER